MQVNHGNISKAAITNKDAKLMKISNIFATRRTPATIDTAFERSRRALFHYTCFSQWGKMSQKPHQTERHAAEDLGEQGRVSKESETEETHAPCKEKKVEKNSGVKPAAGKEPFVLCALIACMRAYELVQSHAARDKEGLSHALCSKVKFSLVTFDIPAIHPVVSKAIE